MRTPRTLSQPSTNQTLAGHWIPHRERENNKGELNQGWPLATDTTGSTLSAFRTAVVEFEQAIACNTEPHMDNLTTNPGEQIIMFLLQVSYTPPKLQWTEIWLYANKLPNPITIRTAQNVLAAAFAKVSCDLDGANVHGHAWMAET